MPRWRYSVVLDPVRTAIASGRDLRISYKAAVEVLKEIRGKKLDKAKRILEDIIEMRRAVPYRRFYGKVGHRRGMGPGRYPVKAAKAILSVLENAEANAEFKGLDTTRLWVVHAAAFQGMKLKKYIPRAFGRATPYFQQLVHIEMGLEERL
ncbi:MAG: 50S ribosomal protein L22 [Thermofilum sp. ex4484_79]|nr:MAG: 50S ribosomal protein L22 [Thermofilum sp. ex4484_79]